MHNLNEETDGLTQGLPLYQKARERLKQQIDGGRWKPGDMLPTEAELGQYFSISAGTVRQAVLALVREGLVTRRPGKGTFVARLDGSKSFARFFRFREGESAKRIDPDIRVINVEVHRTAPPEVARHLNVNPRAKVLFLRRILVHEDTPVCLYDSYLPYRLVGGLENEALDNERLYAVIERRFGIFVVRADEFLRAGVVANEEARLLHLEEGAPVILIERFAYTHGGTILEWRQIVGRSDKFRYKITLP